MNTLSKIIGLFGFLFFAHFTVFAQWTDSLVLAQRAAIAELKRQVDTTTIPDIRFKKMLSIGSRYNWMLNETDSSIYWIKKVRNESVKGSEYYGLSFLYEADLYDNTEEFEKMLSAVNLGKPLFKKLGMMEQYAALLLHEGAYYGIKGPVNQALIILEEAEAISDSLQNYRTAAIACSNMGNFCNDQGRYTEAIQYLLRSVEYREKGEMPISSGLLIYLGSTFKEVGDLDKSILYFQWALRQTQTEEDRFVLGEAEVNKIVVDAYLSLASCFVQLPDVDSAIHYTRLAKEISFALNDSLHISSYYKSRGDIYHLNDSSVASIVAYEKAVSYFTSSVSMNQQVETLLGLSEQYVHLKRTDNNLARAKKLTLKAYSLADDAILIEKRGKAAYLLFQIFSISGEHEQATQFAEEYILIKDSLFNKESQELLVQLQTEYETVRVENENALLQQSQKAQQARLKQQEYLILGVLLVFVLTMGIAFVIYRSRKTLKVANDIIEKSLSEKEILLKEIHHRVKNNLQVVSSLLDLQSRGIEDEKALSTFMEGQNRVKAMSLIHQKLYQNENLAAIDFKEYAELLIVDLATVFKKEENIAVEVNADGNTAFDIDTAVPLGLILNELITNAYKYAFEDVSGRIKVSIQSLETGEHQLTVSDTGGGLPEGFDLQKAKSMGLRLVRRLAKQLYGRVDYTFDNGSKFVIIFRDSLDRKALNT